MVKMLYDLPYNCIDGAIGCDITFWVLARTNNGDHTVLEELGPYGSSYDK